jgi:hypothetical protein
MEHRLKTYFLFFFCFLSFFPLMAQPGNPAPVGGGLILLIISGMVIGIIKLRKKQN